MDEIVDTECIISFISEIELQVWNPSNADDVDIYKSFVAGSQVIGINPGIIQQTIIIQKTYKLKLPDALIAATAIDNNLTLIADNDADFKKVPDLKYINPVQIN
jgi:predicted nucleic acid-binding protein